MSFPEFIGSPCGRYASYTFYRGIKFYLKDQVRVLNLGEFFFIRISASSDPCIGELELLWSEQSSENRLSSVRLYFLPEQTPQGRLSIHGEDEVLMASEKLVLRLDDLVSWVTEQVEWNHGLLACCPDEPSVVKPEDIPQLRSSEEEEDEEDEDETASEEKESTETEPGESDSPSAEKIASESGTSSPPILPPQQERSPSVEKNGPSDEDVDVPAMVKRQPEENGLVVLENAEVSDVTVDKNEVRVIVFSYATYCRYRSVLKRLEGSTDTWIRNVLVVALGGPSNLTGNTHILFCRDTFDHEELAHNELNCEYLVPTLKVKRRKKKGKNIRSTSPGSESNTSEESKETLVKNNGTNNGFKQPPCKTEQEFLQRLYKFMKKRKTPIHRVPHLGFKQIDLFVFFSFAQKLGGYDKITGKRLWKHVYDVLGGDPGSTSAATCTRRHYEKLLLPFERFMEGKEYKPKQSRKQAKPQKKPKDENDVLDKAHAAACKGENEDAYAFTDSNHENSKDSLLNEEQHSGEDMQLPDNYSDDDSKSIWSIQKSVDGREDEAEKNGNKQIKPLIIQKEHNESFSEKERKWNEIRRKNALARKWVRQLRPSRGGKISGSDKYGVSDKEPLLNQQNLSHPSIPDLKQEISPIAPNTLNDVQKSPASCTPSPKVKQELLEPASGPDSSMVSHLQEKLKPTFPHGDKRLDFCTKNNLFPKALEFLPSKGGQMQPKLEPADKKSWCGYSRDSVYQVAPAPERYPYNCGLEMNLIHSFLKQEYKPGVQGEAGVTKPYLMCGNSSESSVLSSAEQDTNNSEAKQNLSQRRPSVIQHTEYVTSPSPSQSPKQMSSDVGSDPASRDMCFSFGAPNAKAPSTPVTHLAHSMTGKVTEWLAKGMNDAVACKTPNNLSEKAEPHEKVLMPSSCKTPGPGTGKVPMFANKNRIEPYNYPGVSHKKATVSYRHSNPPEVKKPSSYMVAPVAKVNPPYQKAFHANATMVNSINPYMKTCTKAEQPFAASCKGKLQNSEPVYSQPKRHKLNAPMMPLTTPLPPRPSLLPFSRQQTYRTSPLSDIPKVTASARNDCTNEVLDLSVKKKPPASPIKPLPLHNSIIDGAVCLDLSVKKKLNHLSRESAIENITPPLPPSTPSHSSKPSKPATTLLALQDMIREETRPKPTGTSKPAAIGSSAQPSIPISSSAVASNSAAYANSAQNKIPSNFIAPFPDAATFTKEMAKSLYLAPDPSQFSPYVIPPFYAANWPATSNLPNNNTTTTHTTPAAASPSIFKEAMSHGVFPKQYMYNLKHQFHPFMCKDNGCYPPSCK